MYVILYRVHPDGHDRIHVSHGGVPYTSKEAAERARADFVTDYEPHHSEVRPLGEPL